MTDDGPVLVVGGTGMLGGQVVTALLSRGQRVRALLRPASDAAELMKAGVINGISSVIGKVSPMVNDMGAMLRWFQTGRYVADPTRQREAFGDVPIAEEAIARLVQRLGHTVPG